MKSLELLVSFIDLLFSGNVKNEVFKKEISALEAENKRLRDLLT